MFQQTTKGKRRKIRNKEELQNSKKTTDKIICTYILIILNVNGICSNEKTGCLNIKNNNNKTRPVYIMPRRDSLQM